MPNPALILPLMEDKLLRILWNDDRIDDYPFTYLRGWCPCATCQGHGGERHFVVANNPQLESVSMVGNYALSPRWGDGHETGIYTFEYLRSLSDQLQSEGAGPVKG